MGEKTPGTAGRFMWQSGKPKTLPAIIIIIPVQESKSTDGRFSGASRGASIGHVSPEAAVGGPIALVEEGDMIAIDIDNCSITLKVSDEELAERRKNWKPRQPKVTTGYLARYASLVTSANRGAILQIKD